MKMRTMVVLGFLLALTLVQIEFVGTIHSPQCLVSDNAILSSLTDWADDFTDGNFDDWTVTIGALDASDGVLRGTTATWNWIYHNSTCISTWSFDVYYRGTGAFNVWFMCNYTQPSNSYRPWDGYFIHMGSAMGNIEMKRDWDGGQVVLASYDPGSLIGWWNIEVNRSSDGWINVRVDGTERMEVQDDKWNESLYFFFESYDQQAIDNIEVGLIDVTTPPTTSTSTTDTTTTGSGQGIVDYLLSNPILLAAIITAVATVCAAGIKRSRG
ncbi:MAG: hypothetical protein RTV41_02575 [Candidatus Thorarchaeota archaeon]